MRLFYPSHTLVSGSNLPIWTRPLTDKPMRKQADVVVNKTIISERSRGSIVGEVCAYAALLEARGQCNAGTGCCVAVADVIATLPTMGYELSLDDLMKVVARGGRTLSVTKTLEVGSLPLPTAVL